MAHTLWSIHRHTDTVFAKCLNRSLYGYSMCTAVLSPPVSHPLLHSSCYRLKVIHHGNTGLDCTRVKRSKFTGSSLGCGELHEARLCEVQGQTASWVEEEIKSRKIKKDLLIICFIYIESHHWYEIMFFFFQIL